MEEGPGKLNYIEVLFGGLPKPSPVISAPPQTGARAPQDHLAEGADYQPPTKHRIFPQCKANQDRIAISLGEVFAETDCVLAARSHNEGCATRAEAHDPAPEDVVQRRPRKCKQEIIETNLQPTARCSCRIPSCCFFGSQNDSLANSSTIASSVVNSTRARQNGMEICPTCKSTSQVDHLQQSGQQDFATAVLPTKAGSKSQHLGET